MVRYCFHRCLSIHTSVGGEGYPGQVQVGEGTLARSSWGGTPCQVGTPSLLGGGLPKLRWGASPARSDGMGDTQGGVPPPRQGLGTPPPPRYRTTDGVLDSPRSVCLLHSRRRPFLFGLKIKVSICFSVAPLCYSPGNDPQNHYSSVLHLLHFSKI